ncbi:hypothetical protein GR925_07805 [Streptomyces sp. HUCO-GS316]|uniref:hypothetical protein n=1 Tax=Streptomyces sp. HUCO-GS316 TaxID=2692198 RepID=UPI00136A62BB|nr:hypothetical protein [Streptomyces sp. HUCO-GS316]MXM63354.1 hypothetical protein [Streptomyces sp. HUCO-GS316]
MGSVKITLCAGLLAAFAFAPTAYAQDGGFSVSPSSPVPGSDVSMRVSDCTEKTGTAVSAAFVADIRLTGTDGTLVGESRIRTAVSAGTYEVKVRCGGADRKGTFTVKHGTAHPSAPSTPVAPVHAGGGGTARHQLSAADARLDGPGTAHAVTGLVLAGAAAVAVALRSARRSRGTG